MIRPDLFSRKAQQSVIRLIEDSRTENKTSASRQLIQNANFVPQKY